MAKDTVKVGMPDGSVVTLPAGLSKEDMAALLRAESPQPAPWARPQFTGPGQVAGNEMVNQWGDNLLNFIPGMADIAGRGLGQLTAGARTLGAAPRLAMQGQSIPDFFNAANQQEQGRGVAAGLQGHRGPTVMDLQAMTMPGDTAQNREQLLDTRMEGMEQFPAAAMWGGVGGDAATLMTGRLPWQRGLQNERFMSQVRQQAGRVTEPTNMSYLMTKLKPSAAKEFKDVWNTKLSKNLRRGFLRAGETGLEGAMLAVMDNGDPVEMATVSAGGQMLGSTIMSLSGNKTGLGLTAAAAIGMTFHQMIKDATPGGKDYILESIEQSYQHLTALLIAGGLMTLAGAGRAPARLQQNMPEIADALTGVPRGGVLSFLKEMTDPRNDVETMELVYGKLARDPDYFGPTARRRLDRAARVENVGVNETVRNLMEDRRFREKVDELHAMRQAAQEKAQRVAPSATLPQTQPQAQPQAAPGMQMPGPGNAAGIPPEMVEAAVQRAQQVPQGQAMQNAQNVNAQQTAARILQSLDGANIPEPQKAQIRRIIGDPSQATEDTLRQVLALTR